jgi:hypothetical protein
MSKSVFFISDLFCSLYNFYPTKIANLLGWATWGMAKGRFKTVWKKPELMVLGGKFGREGRAPKLGFIKEWVLRSYPVMMNGEISFVHLR